MVDRDAATNLLIFSSGMQDLHRKWKWFLLLGIALMLLGVFALALIPIATLGTVLAMGWILIVVGVLEIAHVFRVHRWSGMWGHLIAGILGVLTGLLVITHPVGGALAWTLLFAAMFTVFGAFRLAGALLLKFPNWGWAVLDGVLSILAGIVIWLDWPFSGLWFLGLAVGISLLFRGWSYLMLAVALRSLPAPAEAP